MLLFIQGCKLKNSIFLWNSNLEKYFFWHLMKLFEFINNILKIKKLSKELIFVDQVV